MDRNLLIAFLFSFLILFLWGQLQEQHYPSAPPTAEVLAPTADGKSAEQPKNVSVEKSALAAEPGAVHSEESAAPSEPVVTIEAASEVAPSVESSENTPEQIIEIKNALYRAEFTTRGAALRHFELLQYQDEVGAGSPPVVLTWFDQTQEIAFATSFEELGLGDWSRAAYSVHQPDASTLVFERNQAGVTVRKIYKFQENTYAFSLQIEVFNQSNRSINPLFEMTWPGRVDEKKFVDEQQALVIHQEGKFESELMAAFGKPNFFSKLIGVGKDQDKTRTFDGEIEWVGFADRYFVSAILPDEPAKAQAEFIPLVSGVTAQAVLRYQPIEVLPGSSKARELTFYLGPKEAERLKEMGRNLQRAAVSGYSWVSPLTAFFTWVLMLIHKVIPNYGLAIVAITILVRALTYPIVSQQMKSMKRMAELHPKLKAIQEKHKDDRQALSQATMKLYKEEGVNPLGGCLPAVLQFPVFIGLFFALQSSIELRHAPFVSWIHDLSAPEMLFMIPVADFPFRLLPIIMGASMFLQQRITPMTTMDPLQRKMMTTFMPLMLLAVSYTFPSGLVLYWITSNFLGIGQQFITNRQVPAGLKDVKKK